MSKFRELHVAGLSDQDVHQNHKILCDQNFYKDDICVCCLSQSVPLISLNTCKHANDCNVFSNCKIKCPLQTICGQCHSILVKFSAFKKQVENSLQLLNNHHYLLKPNEKMLNLIQTPIEIFWTVNSEPIRMKTQNADEKFKHPDIFITAGFSADEDTNWNRNSKLTNLKLEFEKPEHLANDNALTGLTAKCSNDFAFLDIKVKREPVDSDDDDNTLDVNDEEETTNKKRRKVSLEVPLNYKGKLKVTRLSKKQYLAEKEAEKRKPSFSSLPFKCEHCVVAFDHEVNLKEHNEKKHAKKEGRIECDLCRSYFCSRHSFLDHYKRHFKRYECVACCKRYTTLHAAGEHCKQQHGGGGAGGAGAGGPSYTCGQCDFTTDSNRKFRYHRQKHKEKEQCTLCGKTFVTKSGLKIHMLTKHSGVPPRASDLRYSCTICAKTYHTKSGLTHHNASVHEQKGAFCVTCQVHFRTKTTYLNHLATNSKHVNDKHQCEECDAKFLTRSALKHHVNYVHLKTVGHPCDRCGKVFPFARTLRRHKDFVHEKKQMPKNKICDHCGKGFSTLSILRAHVRTHTGERPLHCAHCPAAFAHPAARYNHTRLLHAPAAIAPPPPAHTL